MTFADRHTATKPRLGQRIGLGCLGALVLLVGSCTGYDYGARYSSWARLDKARVLTAASDYARDLAPGQKVCLYRVACDERRARLVLVKDVAVLDVEAVRQIAWERRFGGTCPG